MPQGTAIFVDTSIQIARRVHGSELKVKIEARLKNYDIVVSSEVVKQEFKRRLLKEAQYLLNQLNRLGSHEKVNEHVINILPPQQNRKRNICLQVLSTVMTSREDGELTERARRLLRNFLKYGLDQFEDEVGSLVRDVGCACSRHPVIEKKPYKDYDFGTDHCSKTKGACGVVAFLRDRRDLLLKVLDGLKSIPSGNKTDELDNAQKFIEQYLENTENATSLDPCLKIGDLMIALESVGIPEFYTLNARESIYLCRFLEQDLIVRPKHHAHEDVIHPRTDTAWESGLENERS